MIHNQKTIERKRMEKIRVPKGTRDIFDEEILLWHRVEEAVRCVSKHFGFGEIRTPYFEHTELFVRGVGEETDIVQKEMYTFSDKGGRSLTLRPEGTAPVMRAYLEHGLHVSNPRLKWYYMGPMFRYERPQAGRMRQFHQFGYESLGFESPSSDTEIILLSWLIYQQLGLTDINIEVNSLGCHECKNRYVQVLRSFLSEGRLCSTCCERAEKNPLRVMDCKEAECRELFQSPSFPTIQKSLCPSCKKHQEEVLHGLKTLAIPFILNPLLVRGLDYYVRTVFEVKAGGPGLGAQDAIGGGGRYDNLSDALGVKGILGVGFAAGMERIILLLKQRSSDVLPREDKYYLAPLDRTGEIYLLSLARQLNRDNILFYVDFADKGIKYHLKKAQKMGIRYVILCGEKEAHEGKYAVKDLESGAQISHDSESLFRQLRRRAE